MVILNCSLLRNQNDHKTLVNTNPRCVTSQKNEDLKTHLGINVKLPMFLPDFNQIRNTDNFSQKYPISNFMKIRPVRAAMIHANRHDKGHRLLSRLGKGAYKLLYFSRGTLGCSKRSLQQKPISSLLSTDWLVVTI